MINALNLILKGQSLSQLEASAVMNQLAEGQFEPAQAGAFLAALRMKGETIDEIVGFVSNLRGRAVNIEGLPNDLIDVCGTGGDGAQTFNISTTVAFVVAASGQPIAKHGNRSVSSRSGSADVLDALGLESQNNPEQAKEALKRFGATFLFAPAFHPALKILAPLRKQLGVSTVFNIMGPLLNPARVKRQVMGVFSVHLIEKLAQVLKELGSEEVMLVNGGQEGLDELSISGESNVAHLKNGQIRLLKVSPRDFGFKEASIEEIRGGDPQENARILIDVLKSQKGPKRDLVLMNASAALVVGGKASDFREGVRIAAQTLDSGKAFALFDSMRKRR